MKHMQIIVQEPYEAPAISEIAPVTITYVAGTTQPPDGDNDDDF